MDFEIKYTLRVNSIWLRKHIINIRIIKFDANKVDNSIIKLVLVKMLILLTDDQIYF